MGYGCMAEEKLGKLTELSRYVSEVANMPPFNQRPFCGKERLCPQGGVHVSAILKNPAAYEHIDPEKVGNRRRVLVSDLAGQEQHRVQGPGDGCQPGGQRVGQREDRQEIKKLEDQGYQFDAAEGSLELLIKKVTGQFQEPFNLESFRVTMEKNRSGPSTSHATIKISVADEHEITAAEGDGPVNALDNALRKALHKFFPQVEEMRLVDFKVRVIDGSDGTAARCGCRSNPETPARSGRPLAFPRT
jgi:2-isopropylmalate synthase